MNENIDVNGLINYRFCPEKSVHMGKRKRFQKALEQLTIPIIDTDSIIKWTNEFIVEYGLAIHSGDNIVKTENISLDDFNKKTKETYKGITSNADLVWMKLTNDKRLGVVACSNDINFDIPPNSDVYDKPQKIVAGKIKSWRYNTSGILVHSVGLKWDESYVLVFPLLGLMSGKEGTKQRHDIERGIGNYLISKNVPIIDYYSHRL